MIRRDDGNYWRLWESMVTRIRKGAGDETISIDDITVVIAAETATTTATIDQGADLARDHEARVDATTSLNGTITSAAAETIPRIEARGEGETAPATDGMGTDTILSGATMTVQDTGATALRRVDAVADPTRRSAHPTIVIHRVRHGPGTRIITGGEISISMATAEIVVVFATTTTTITATTEMDDRGTMKWMRRRGRKNDRGSWLRCSRQQLKWTRPVASA